LFLLYSFAQAAEPTSDEVFSYGQLNIETLAFETERLPIEVVDTSPYLEEQAAKEAEKAQLATQRQKQALAPNPTVNLGGVEQWRGLVSQHFPPHEVDRALAVMRGESGGNPNAVGDTTLMFNQGGIRYGASYGLMQIRHLSGRPSPDWLLVPENNISYAAGMWRSQGWCPWTVAVKLGYCRR
jgi:soluble lytic murein transglycosylase-like protein